MQKTLLLCLISLFLVSCAGNEEIATKAIPIKEMPFSDYLVYNVEKAENIDTIFSDAFTYKQLKKDSVSKKYHKRIADPQKGFYKYAYRIRQQSNKKNVLRLYTNKQVTEKKIRVRLDKYDNLTLSNAKAIIQKVYCNVYCRM